METPTQTIASLNDRLRKEGIGGQVMITHGIKALADDVRANVIQAVRNFDDFSSDNDPYKEHDCASLTVAGEKVIWKIDYYDRDLQFASEDPADESITSRIMTIMLANEY